MQGFVHLEWIQDHDEHDVLLRAHFREEYEEYLDPHECYLPVEFIGIKFQEDAEKETAAGLES